MSDMEIVRLTLMQREWPLDTPYLGVLNQPVFGTSTQVPTLNWTLVSEVASNHITEPILHHTLNIFAFISLMVLGFVGITLAIARWTLRPIRRANDAIERVAQGNLQTSGVRELDVMTNGINAMSKAREAAERKLVDRERELSVLLNSVPVAVITIDERGTLLSFNAAAEKTFGDTPRGKPRGFLLQ